MAEKQFTTYKADVTSFELREAMLGVIEPGRYRGYSDITSGGTPVGGLIPIHINHTTTGIQKGTHASTPVLSDKTGVVVTPQGTIIHNTDTDIDVSIEEGIGQTGDRYDLIYLEHKYYDVIGSNPSTIGVKKGTDGGGVPALDKPAEQVAIIQVKIVNTANLFSGLQFTVLSPAIIGDYGINTEIQNVVNNIIGDRSYSENNFITNLETITDSIDKLDVALKDEEDARVAIGDRAIDDSNWAALSDITTFDFSTTKHGFVPKGSTPTYSSWRRFLDSDGTFLSLLEFASKYQPELLPNAVTWDRDDLQLPSGTTSGYIDVGQMVPSGFAGMVVLKIQAQYNTAQSDLASIAFWANSNKASTGPRIILGNSTYNKVQYNIQQIVVPVSADLKVYWSCVNPTHFLQCDITFLGRITTRIE